MNLDLVLIDALDTQRSNWPLGSILETYQGANDLVQTVKSETQNGEMIQPASKVALVEAAVKKIVYIWYKQRYKYDTNFAIFSFYTVIFFFIQYKLKV